MTLFAPTAAEYLGGDGAGFRFTSTAPLTPQLSRFWRDTITRVDQDLRAEQSALGYPLVLAGTLRMLVAAALTVFPNTVTTADYIPGAGHVRPAAIRRAVAFIDAHADQPITLAQIAAAAGVGPRALQQGFRHHRNQTPMQYARQARLSAAHRELQATDPATGATVRDIAARWGFGKPDRFTAAYKAAFGTLPSHTLRS